MVIYLFSGFKYLKIAGVFRVSFLDPIRGLAPPDPIQGPIDPCNIRKAQHMLAKDGLLTLFYPLFKTSSI